MSEELIKLLRIVISKLKPGTRVTLPDLFPNIMWNEISKDRKAGSLGQAFYALVEKMEMPGIASTHKVPHESYERMEYVIEP
jgi:hypothetical protein